MQVLYKIESLQTHCHFYKWRVMFCCERSIFEMVDKGWGSSQIITFQIFHCNLN